MLSGEPSTVVALLSDIITFENPKSAILTCPFLRRRLASLRSLWRMLCQRRALKPSMISTKQRRTSASGSLPRALRWHCRSPPSQNSVTRQMLLVDLRMSLRRRMKLFLTVLRMCISDSKSVKILPFRSTFRICFTATSSFVLMSVPQYTSPNWPCPIFSFSTQLSSCFINYQPTVMKHRPRPPTDCSLRLPLRPPSPLHDRSFDQRALRPAPAANRQFLKQSKLILDSHFAKDERACSNGCPGKARFFAESIQGRLFFCSRCAQNLNDQAFKVMPIEGTPQRNSTPGRQSAKQPGGVPLMTRLQLAENKLSKQLMQAKAHQQRVQRMLGDCLEEIESSFTKVLGWLKEWRMSVYARVDSDVKQLRAQAQGNLNYLQQAQRELAQATNLADERQLGQKADALLKYGFVYPELSSDAWLKDFRLDLSRLGQCLSCKCQTPGPPQRKRQLNSAQILALLSCEGRIAVRPRARGQTIHLSQSLADNPLEW